MSFKIMQPTLFKQVVQNQPLKVFLCGPGYEAQGFKAREDIKKYLLNHNVDVTYGEQLSSSMLSIRKSDLQTIEARFAATTDFTILMLESPGSIAELGTFSMMSAVRPRLFVLVPTRFYGAESYIARGPLSLISASNRSNIVYFKSSNDPSLIRMLDRTTSLYKYARYIGGANYYMRFISPYRPADIYQQNYEAEFSRIKEGYQEIVVLSAIIAINCPTFSELVSVTGLHPDDVAHSLALLFKKKSIEKQNSRYRSVFGYKDNTLRHVSTTQLSKIKSLLMRA